MMASHNQQHHQHGLIGSGFPNILLTATNETADLLGLQANMEILGIPGRHQRSFADHQHHNQNPNSSNSMWRGLIKPHQEFLESSNLMIDESPLRSLYNSEDHHHNQNIDQTRTNLSLSNPNSSPLQQQQILIDDHEGRFFQQQQQVQQLYNLRSSKYLVAGQELLNEFACLGRDINSSTTQIKLSERSNSKWEDKGGGGAASSYIYNLDFLELQRRKARLLSMLEEVDRRYKRYREQMRVVVSSFEAVAGEGAAMVYSTLASKAISRHFRCLRDGIVGQIKVAKKAMGEKDPIASGTTHGETPRLRLLDQFFRQHKAFQQGGFMENHPWRPQRGLPERSVSILRAWLFEHFLHPYPSDVDKHILARQTGLSRSQVSNWFINARVRLWKPMVEEMYTKELKEEVNGSEQSSNAGNDEDMSTIPNPNPKTNGHGSSSSQLIISEDHKPYILQCSGLHDPESLSSVVSTRKIMMMGSKSKAEIDSSAYGGGSNHQGFGGGVSLTLGLQQHNNIAFSPPGTAHHSLYFSPDQTEDCQQMEDLQYRNFGAQLLHDLAG